MMCVCLGSEILFNFVFTEASDLYLLEGHHVKLDIHGHEDFRREEIDFVHWSFHGPVVRYYPAKEKLEIIPQYVVEDGVKFDSRNFSMKLKNLQKVTVGFTEERLVLQRLQHLCPRWVCKYFTTFTLRFMPTALG